MQALVKFAKSISVENFGFELAVKLRFLIPNFILVPMLNEYETEVNIFENLVQRRSFSFSHGFW